MQLFNSASRPPVEGNISFLSDRRQRKRRVLRGTAYIVIPGRSPLPARLLDICATGISISAAVNAPTGAECGLRFPLRLGREALLVETAVVVAHSIFSRVEDGFRIGFQFKRLTAEQAKAIERYIRY